MQFFFLEILLTKTEDPDKPHLKLKEKDVVESAFMIYVPKATGLKTENLRKSTWLNPLVDGEEARKLMGMFGVCYCYYAVILFVIVIVALHVVVCLSIYLFICLFVCILRLGCTGTS